MSEEVKKKRKFEKKSKWWNDFTEVIPNKEAKCNIDDCPEPKIVFNNKTTALERHTKKYHNEKFKDIMKITTIDKTFSNQERKEISKYTVLMIIMENRPFDMINGKWYKLMMNKIQINWKPTDHKTFDNYLEEIYEEIYIEVKTELNDQIFFCQTSDGWKSQANDQYYSINLHYINEKWKYCTINLGTVSIEEEHITGEAVSNEYLKLYADFEIENTEIVEVIDGGPNLIKAAEKLNHLVLHCNNHALQLPINRGLEEVLELKVHCSKIVRLFRQSGPALNKLKAAQLQNESKKLVLIDDNETRWNSFFLMIERVYKLKDDLNIAFDLIKKDKLIKTKLTNLTEENYKDIKLLIEFLEPFKIATKYFEETTSGTNISVSGMIPVIHNLLKHITKFKNKELSEELKNMAEVVEEEITERWINVDIMFYSTSFINPVFKKLKFLKESKIKEIKKFIQEQIELIKIEKDESSEEEVKEKKDKFKKLFGLELNEEEDEDSNELINYDNELPQKFDIDVFKYWKSNTLKYPKLSVVARKLLCLQGSSSDVERDNSFMGNMITEKRTNLKPEKICKMVFIKKNIRFSKYFKEYKKLFE